MKDAGEKGFAGSFGNRAALRSISSNSSLSSSGSNIELTKDALLEKKEKRFAIAGLETTCTVESRCGKLVAPLLDDSTMTFKGSALSFAGDGTIPMLIGSDSPLNQSASFPAFSSDLPVSMENLLDRVGDDCRDCFGEEWQSFGCGDGSSGGMVES